MVNYGGRSWRHQPKNCELTSAAGNHQLLGSSNSHKNCTAEQWGGWLVIPLKHAIAAGGTELAGELVQAGAHGDPISEAIRAGQHGIIKQLGQKPGDRHLRLAWELRSEALVSLLLELGADPDPELHWKDDAFTPVHLAAKAGQAGIVDLLLDAGADVGRRCIELTSMMSEHLVARVRSIILR